MTQAQQPQPYYPPPTSRPSNGLGTAALVLGIIAVVVGLIPILFVITFVLALLAIVFGFIGRSRAKRGQATNKGMATWGAALGLAGFVLGIVGVVIVNDAFEDLGDDTDTSSSDEPITSSDNEANPPAEDVTIDSCELDDFGIATAGLTVLNHSSEASTYLLTIELVDPSGTRVGEAVASLDALAPGQTAMVDAVGTVDGSPDTVTCELVRAERFAS